LSARELKKVLLPFKNIQIYQDSFLHGISSDTNLLIERVLLENSQKSMKILDLGCGNGIIAIMLKLARPTWQISAIDIQSVALAKRNSALAKVKIDFKREDLRTYKNQYDLIVTNPPYYTIKENRISPNIHKAIAKSELECTMRDIVNCVGRCLKKNGTAYILYPNSRLSELEKMDIQLISKTVFAKVFVAQVKKKIDT